MTKLQQIHLGKNGPLVSILGLGTMGMSEYYGQVDAQSDAESLKVLNEAIDMGCNFFDTADIYGNGLNEKLLSQVLATRRDEVFICTKFAVQRNEAGNVIGLSGKPEYVHQACEASLKRLGIDTIDLYYQHRVDPKTPIEETVKAMAELVKQGKVRYLGLSECSAENIRRAHAVHPIAAYQVEYSPWALDIESDGRLQACRELGIQVIAYSPLGRGFLTGRYKSSSDFEEGDFRKGLPRFQPGVFEKNLELVKELEKLAARKGIKSSQVCLAWIMAQDILPIPGTRQMKYLKENIASTSITLTKEEMNEIRDIISKIPIDGTQYAAANMSTINA